MILSAYYNDINQTLVLTSSKQTSSAQQILNDDMLLFKEDDEVVGANIFQVSYEPGYVPLENIAQETLDLFSDKLESPFVIGQILEATPIENTKLKDCLVDIGSEQLKIVCGASNCEANKLAVVARVGAVMPSGLLIRPSKLQGYDSFGMLCSEKELGLAEESTGIILYDNDPKKVGSSLMK